MKSKWGVKEMEGMMKRSNKLDLLLIAILFAGLSACSAAATTATATLTPVSPTFTSPSIPVAITSSPLPIHPIILIITPDPTQVERWEEYENALAKSVLSFLPPEKVLCEWDILGQNDQDIYVWAVCAGQISAGSVPAVIHLETDGSIQAVEVPGTNWSSDILELFPEHIREKFDYYNSGRADDLLRHLEWRRTHPEEPPLIIVLSGTPKPTHTEWLPFNPNVINNDECEKLVPTAIPVAGTENLTHEEISQKLFALYLEKHITLPPHHFCKLENYRIERTTIDHRIDFLAQEQGVDFVNWIIYSIQIREVPSSWVAGNGELANDGWIVNKVLIIGVTKVGDEYVLTILGTGP